ncbi:hypothetical protein [Roseateles oligotrophus]|uniref:Uncharacterized protein n=1 Tax=Roseateles oligotrophus TaxID=1769250 RepID=A0ABT2YE41_9BURK|nr:hypothetical protein [Roseateles oligotrophus]MCV2368260.1 hypothetical protein [Roseateles oligotrophus]
MNTEQQAAALRFLRCFAALEDPRGRYCPSLLDEYMSFSEDNCRIRSGDSQQKVEILRRIASNLIKQDKSSKAVSESNEWKLPRVSRPVKPCSPCSIVEVSMINLRYRN